MKEFLNKFGEVLIIVFIVMLLIIASPFIIVWLVIKTIKDYFKYIEGRYYQVTREKYSWLCAGTPHICFYNDIKDAGLPIKYYRDKSIRITGYGYFIYNSTLILCDYDSETLFFDKEKNEWLVYEEHDYLLLENKIDEEIKKVNEFLGEEVCNNAIIFVESDLLEDVPEIHYEKIEFLSVTEGNKVSALKKYYSMNL